MVQVDADGQPRVLHGGLDELHEIDMLGIFPGPGGDLEDQGGTHLGGGFRDALDDLHIIDVERADGIAALVGIAEHFGRSNDGQGYQLLSRKVYHAPAENKRIFSQK